MAATEEQAGETNAATSSADNLGRSAPAALRKQQGGGSAYRDAENERLAILKKENKEFRDRWGREDERQKKHQHDMAEAWKKHQRDEAAKRREERQTRLAKLQVQTEERYARQAQKREQSVVHDDPEYHMLIERYGDKIRVPSTIARLALEDKSHNASMESSTSVPRKPRVPQTKTKAGRAADDIGESVVKVLERSGYGVQKEGALPPITPAGGNNATDALAGESTVEIPEPERSLMPRKDRLRKFQQAILKKTDVSFYKGHMKRHLRRILDVTEVTFSDQNARREQASWNLAKPLSIAEIKQLNCVGVRQP